MVNVVKVGGRAPPPSPARANFTLMMECTLKSGRYHSVYSVLIIVICSSSSRKISPVRSVKGHRRGNYSNCEIADVNVEEESGKFFSVKITQESGPRGRGEGPKASIFGTDRLYMYIVDADGINDDILYRLQ